MRCDDFLPSLEAGGFLKRLLAHLHAARCDSCAAERQQWRALRRNWSRPPELSAEHRAVWEQAAERFPGDTPPIIMWPQRARWPRVGLAATVLLLAAGGLLSLTLRDSKPQRKNIALEELNDPRPHWRTTAKFTELTPLEQMQGSLDELAAELQQLGREAELLDARRDLDRLSTIYVPLGPADASQAIPN